MDDLLEDILSYLTFNEVCFTWTRLSKEMNERVEQYHRLHPVTRFDHTHGCVDFLPTIRSSMLPLSAQMDESEDTATAATAATTATTATTRCAWIPYMVDPICTQQWFDKYFSNVITINLSHYAMCREVNDIGLMHLSRLDHVRSLNISNCRELGWHSSKYVSEFLACGLTELVAENIKSPFVLIPPFARDGDDADAALAAEQSWIMDFVSVGYGDLPVCSLVTLSVANNSWLEWRHVQHILKSCPVLESLDVSYTNVCWSLSSSWSSSTATATATATIDLSQLPCRHTLKRIKMRNCKGVSREIIDDILRCCLCLEQLIY